jgi:GntR family transcriptional regulator
MRTVRARRPRGARPSAIGRRVLGSGERTVTPLYHQMYLVLRQRIRDGEYPDGRPLPGEHQLAGQFGVSRVTVRRTLQQLEAEGLVVRRRGSGTFPAARPAELQDRYNIGGLKDAQLGGGGDAVITTLAAGMAPAPAHVAAIFGAGAPSLLRIERQRAIGRDAPFTLLTTWVHPDHAGKLGPRQRRSVQTLAALEDAGVEMVRAEQAVTARAADERAAALLGVPVGAPLIGMTTLFTDREDEPVVYLEALYRPDRYEYRLTMVRRSGGRGERWQAIE